MSDQQSVGSFIDKLKDLGLELVFRHGPWFALTCWLLAYGFPSLVDQVNNGYREVKTDISKSIEKLADSIEKSTEESRLFRLQVSGILDGKVRQRENEQAK